MGNKFSKYPDLKNKTVVITGASGGIGRGLCRAFLACHSRVILVYRNEKPDFSISRKQQKRIVFLQADITELDTVSFWLKDFYKQGVQVDILINNAGVNLSRPLIECDERDWEFIINTNLKATFFFSQLFARYMKKKSSGVIINATSFASNIPSAFGGLYAASKAALRILTKCMAAEWAPYGIRVNAFSPGVIPTKMTKPAIMQRKEQLVNAISMRRFGNIKEVANAVLFLASCASSYITGIDLEISGGKFLIQDPVTPWRQRKAR